MDYSYLMEVLIAADQLINTLIPGGWADETFSARCYRMQSVNHRWLIMRKTVDTVFFLQKEHCFQAYTSELNRIHSPPDVRRHPVV